MAVELALPTSHRRRHRTTNTTVCGSGSGGPGWPKSPTGTPANATSSVHSSRHARRRGRTTSPTSSSTPPTVGCSTSPSGANLCRSSSPLRTTRIAREDREARERMFGGGGAFLRTGAGRHRPLRYRQLQRLLQRLAPRPRRLGGLNISVYLFEFGVIGERCTVFLL
jgi:hypothetical protein